MRRLCAAGLLLLAAAAPPGVLAAAPPGVLAAAPPGAASCSGCHAVRTATIVPPLAGRPAPEIVAMLAAFRAGTRPATVMNRIAPGFTAAESEAIAAWWAAQPAAPTP